MTPAFIGITYPQDSYTDTSGASNAFYRVEVALPNPLGPPSWTRPRLIRAECNSAIPGKL